MTDPPAETRLRELMMAALDGEISEDERKRLDEHLHDDPAAAREWRRLTRAKEVTTTMTPQEPSHEVWQTYWTGVYRRVERGLGWILFSVGAIALSGYGIWKAVDALFADTSVPGLVRLAVLVGAIGLAILIISVVREKLFVNRNEPYKDVTR